VDIEAIEASRTALLIMDVQRGIVAGYVQPGDSVLERIAGAVSIARASGQVVVYVRIGFRPNHPDVSANNSVFSGVASAGLMLANDESTQLHPSAGFVPGDIEVVKRRVSAFEGTDLEVVLRSRGINTLVLAGIATSGVVLSTLRQAVDRDYRVIVLSDCCKDLDATVHGVLMERVYPTQATVIDTAAYRSQSPVTITA
jgi:nicotinamidase-related amidase